MGVSRRRRNAMTEERPKEKERYVRGLFASIAGRYDLFNIIASFGFDRGWRRFAAEKTGLPVGGRALDICAGTGDLAIAVGKRRQPAQVLATDFCREMLDVGRKKVAGTPEEHLIKFEWADVTDLPYDDGSFDAVTVGFGIRNVGEIGVGLAEVRRVLRPGGRFVCLEFSRPVWWPLRVFYRFYLFRVVPLVGRVITGNYQGFRYLASSIANFPNQDRLRDTMLEAGFSRVEFFNLTGGIVAVHVAEN